MIRAVQSPSRTLGQDTRDFASDFALDYTACFYCQIIQSFLSARPKNKKSFLLRCVRSNARLRSWKAESSHLHSARPLLFLFFGRAGRKDWIIWRACVEALITGKPQKEFHHLKITDSLLPAGPSVTHACEPNQILTATVATAWVEFTGRVAKPFSMHTGPDAETKVADFALRAKLKRQLPCHYALILNGAIPSGHAHWQASFISLRRSSHV